MTTLTIDELKKMAVAANDARDWAALQTVIEILDDLWEDNRAALAFYTQLEEQAGGDQ